jgi:hypothetical protein
MQEVFTVPAALPLNAAKLTCPTSESGGARLSDKSLLTATPDTCTSQAAAGGAAVAPTVNKEERWVAENQMALESSNEFVARRGLPLAKHRAF